MLLYVILLPLALLVLAAVAATLRILWEGGSMYHVVQFFQAIGGAVAYYIMSAARKMFGQQTVPNEIAKKVLEHLKAQDPATLRKEMVESFASDAWYYALADVEHASSISAGADPSTFTPQQMIEFCQAQLEISFAQLASYLNLTEHSLSLEYAKTVEHSEIKINRLKALTFIAYEAFQMGINGRVILNMLNEPFEDGTSLLHYVVDDPTSPLLKAAVQHQILFYLKDRDLHG